MWARGFIRGALGIRHAEVTSPTFLLDNVYATRSGALVHHMDLYRLKDPVDAESLGLQHIFEHDISVIEWPQRLVAEDEISVDASISSNQIIANPRSALPEEFLLVHLVTETEPEYEAHLGDSLKADAAPRSRVFDDILNGGHGHKPVNLHSSASMAGSGSSTPEKKLSAKQPHQKPAMYEIFEDTLSRMALFYARGRRYEALLESLVDLDAAAPVERQLR